MQFRHIETFNKNKQKKYYFNTKNTCVLTIYSQFGF